MLRSWWIKQFKPLSPVRMDWECAFVYNLLNYFPGRWSWKSNVVLETVLEESLKNGCIFCLRPVFTKNSELRMPTTSFAFYARRLLFVVSREISDQRSFCFSQLRVRDSRLAQVILNLQSRVLVNLLHCSK